MKKLDDESIAKNDQLNANCNHKKLTSNIEEIIKEKPTNIIKTSENETENIKNPLDLITNKEISKVSEIIDKQQDENIASKTSTNILNNVDLESNKNNDLKSLKNNEIIGISKNSGLNYKQRNMNNAISSIVKMNKYKKKKNKPNENKNINEITNCNENLITNNNMKFKYFLAKPRSAPVIFIKKKIDALKKEPKVKEVQNKSVAQNSKRINWKVFKTLHDNDLIKKKLISQNYNTTNMKNIKNILKPVQNSISMNSSKKKLKIYNIKTKQTNNKNKLTKTTNEVVVKNNGSLLSSNNRDSVKQLNIKTKNITNKIKFKGNVKFHLANKKLKYKPLFNYNTEKK